MQNNFGYVKPEIDDTQYIYGGFLSGVPKDIIQPSGDWTQYLPVYEPQFSVGFDTYGCTVWGTHNCIEILSKKIYGAEPNYSERFNYILSNVRPPGGDPHKIAESIRKGGVIDQSILPMTDTYEKFIQPNPMLKELLDKGEDWLKNKNFLHEWVFTNNPTKEARIALMRQALQYSPLGISVTAWFKNEQGQYIDCDQPNSHWVCCYKMDEDGTMYIFDSYDGNNPSNPSSYLKTLDSDHHIEVCKRYYIGVNPPLQQTSFWQNIIEIIRQLFQQPLTSQNKKNIVSLQNKLDKLDNMTPYKPLNEISISNRLYELAYSLIGKHLTLDTSIPFDVGCAEALSYVLKEYGFPMPARGIASTNEMEKWLINNCTEIKEPELGSIIISVSYTGVKNARGHCGIVGKKAIMSNDSITGEWQPYWSMLGWLKFYKDDRKLRTRYFKLKN